MGGTASKRYVFQDHGRPAVATFRPIEGAKSYKNKVYNLCYALWSLHMDNYFQFEQNHLIENKTDAMWAWNCPWKKRLSEGNRKILSYAKKLQLNEEGAGEARCQTTFVISRESWCRLKVIPSHEEAKQMGILIEVPVFLSQREFSAWMKTKIVPFGEDKYVLGYSHKWPGIVPDDENNTLLKLIKNDIRENGFVWLSYCSVPQLNSKEKLRHQCNIPRIMAQITVVPIHLNEHLQEDYECSIWCQLEMLMMANTKQLSSSPNREFRAYHWNEIYVVLPYFVAFYCENLHLFLRHEAHPTLQNFGWLRSEILIEIMESIITQHEKNS